MELTTCLISCFPIDLKTLVPKVASIN